MTSSDVVSPTGVSGNVRDVGDTSIGSSASPDIEIEKVSESTPIVVEDECEPGDAGSNV